MPNLATWMRASDVRYFQRFFKLRPSLKILDARTEPERIDLDTMDGLLLAGGSDLSAEWLRQEIADTSLIRGAQSERDEWEFESLRRILRREKPVFAICKGIQLLNVALGGTLHLDIPGHNLPGSKTANIQPLRFAAGVACRFPLVNSSHHQAIDRLGEGLEVEAWCVSDDIIEQMRIRDYPFGLGVQYHPERDIVYARLFEDFFDSLEK
jgi:putative glutamine amidotransferase